MENEEECPICHQENQKILRKLNHQNSTISDEKFKVQVEKSTDGFSSMIDMLSRGEINIQKIEKKKQKDENPFDQHPSQQPASKKILATRIRFISISKSQRLFLEIKQPNLARNMRDFQIVYKH